MPAASAAARCPGSRSSETSLGSVWRLRAGSRPKVATPNSGDVAAPVAPEQGARPASAGEIRRDLEGHFARVANHVGVAVSQRGEPVGGGDVVAPQVPESAAALVSATTVELHQQCVFLVEHIDLSVALPDLPPSIGEA